MRLRMQGDDLIGDLLDVGDAAESYFHLRGHVVAGAHQGVGHNGDVTRAVGTFAIIDAGDVSGSERFDGAAFDAADDHDATIGHGINRALRFEESPEWRKDDRHADEEKGQAKKWKHGKSTDEGVVGTPARGVRGAKGHGHPKKGKASERNPEDRNRKCAERGAARVGDPGPTY